MYKLDEPIIGDWSIPSFPETVEIDGTRFRIAERKQPYPGVIQQYREETPVDSMHLMVLDDGRWCIDHVDEYNPDMGHPIRHFIKDHPVGRILVYTGAGLGMMGIAIARGKNDAKEPPK